MTSTQFKKQVKSIRETLKGQSLTVYGYGKKRNFNTLKSFGEYILSIIEDDSTCYIDDNEFFIYPKLNMLKAIQEFGTTV